jgi:hypothetical protein
VSNLLEGQVALANVQRLSTTDVFRKRASRGGVLLGLVPEFLWDTHRQSPAVDRPFPLLGKAASAEGQDTVPKHVRVVKYISCGRNIVQRETEFRKGQRNYGVVTRIFVPPSLESSG